MRSRDELMRDTEPFPESVIKQLPPRGDNYVSWQHYAQRLLLYYGGYDWRVSSVTHVDGVWAVVGELVVGNTVYGAVGEDNTPTSAESNAFKRACAKAGIGLHLYGQFWLHDRLKKEGS